MASDEQPESDGMMGAFDPDDKEMDALMEYSMPRNPDFSGLMAQCPEPENRRRALHEIVEVWKRVAGPPMRPPRGYRVRLVNRIAQADEEGQAVNVEVTEGGMQALFMIFSIFSRRFVEYASIESVDGSGDVRIWERRPTPWKDSWAGMDVKYAVGNDPTGYNCVRDKIVVDQFTAYFMGITTGEDRIAVREGSHVPVYNEKTGMVAAVDLDVLTDGLEPGQYTAQRDFMFQVIINAITARIATAAYAAAYRETIRNNMQAASDMMAADMQKMKGGEHVTPLTVSDLFQECAKRSSALMEAEEAGMLTVERESVTLHLAPPQPDLTLVEELPELEPSEPSENDLEEPPVVEID